MSNSTIATSLLCDNHLTQAQRADVAVLQQWLADVFSPLPALPRHKNLIEHHFETWPYSLPEQKRQTVQKELAEVIKLGVIGESHSSWWSPIVLEVIKDGSIWFRADYCEVLWFDAYPMPRVNELLVPGWALLAFLQCWI